MWVSGMNYQYPSLYIKSNPSLSDANNILLLVDSNAN